MDLRVIRSPKIRVLPRPEDGLRALVDSAPRAEALAGRTLERAQPLMSWFYASRRRLATVGVVVVTVWLSLHVLLGANGMVVYRQKKSEYQELQKSVQELQLENQRTLGQIQNLKTNPQTIEKEAREQLHYARPGEVVYVAPRPAAPPAPENKAARK
ncbi:MAG: septum formation initiator family protein [Acidobacteria bacterium]|nr:septum formation initiator family protein [Acidobacteriota bacterium]